VAEIHPLRSDAQLRREASEWIARLNGDHIIEEERTRFESWRSAHPRHARAYEEVLMTWRQLNDTGELVRAVALGQTLSASTQEAIRRTVARPTRRLGLLAAAAVAAIAIGVAWWIDSSSPRTLFQTAIGERASVELPDGSSLELNSNSRARVDYSDQERIVRLERGEAYFQVEHDTQRPFWVVARGSWVRAVGTAFNVYVRPSGIRVTVSEGIVKVAASAPTSSEAPSDAQLARASVAVLRPGQQVNVQGAAAEVRSLETLELTRSMSWRSGSIYFKDERLADVVDELSRYTTLKIVIEDEPLRELDIGGTFEANAHGAEALLATLQDGFGLEVRREGESAHITHAE
jgi:transmembrane sensor